MSLFSKIFSGNSNQKLIAELETFVVDQKYDEALNLIDQLQEKDNLNKKVNYFAGITNYHLDDLTKAEDCFKFSADEFPKSNYYLSIISKKKHDYKKAVSYLEKYTLNNDEVSSLELLGSFYIKNKDYKKVLSLSDKLKNIRGDISSAYTLAAEAYLHLENPKRAIIEINKLLEFDLENDHGFELRGKAKTLLKDIDKAISDLENAVRLNKENYEAHFNLGVCFSSKKDYQKALEHLDQSIEFTNSKSALELRAEIKLKIDDPDSALSDIENLVKQSPKSAKYLLKASDLKLKLYDIVGAKKDLEKVLKIEDENVQALYKLSKLEFNEKNYKVVIKYLTRAIAVKLDPKIIELRGRAFYHIDDLQSAAKDLSKVIEINPEIFSAFYFRAKVKEKLKDNYGAITDYTKALNDQKFIDAYYSRGKLRLSLKEFNTAAKDFSKAIKLKPTEAIYYYLRAQCYNKLDKTIEAVEDLDKAISIKSNFVQAILLRGMIGFANRSFSKAKSDFEKVIQIDKRYEQHVEGYLNKLTGKMT